MSRTYRRGERRIRVKAIRRESPDLKRLSRVALELAKAKAEMEAEAEARTRDTSTDHQDPSKKRSTPEGDAT
jgi:hypothetical protein